MPVKAEQREGKWRVVNVDTGDIEVNAAGTPVDGGGHETESDASSQARAINARKGVRAELVGALELGLPGFLTNEDPAVADGLAITIRTGDPVGPFAGITEVPVGVLEIMPVSELARFKDARALFWVPLEASPSEVGAATAAERWVARKSGDGYGVFKGSKKGGQHKTQAAAQKCADARNKMAKAGLPGDMAEDVMHAIVSRMEELTTGEAGGHHHVYQRGAAETGPPIPADDHDEHTHKLPEGAPETASAPLKTSDEMHAHARDPAELAVEDGDSDDPTE